jgi:hypothetical protein
MTESEHFMVMVKFANWIKTQKINIVVAPEGNIWSSSYQGGRDYTSEELMIYFYKHLDIPIK